MHIKGAVHIHSKLSHDGTMSVEELARFYREKGYHFVAMSEHSQDINQTKADELRRACAENSSEEFCMIPGIEYSCEGGMHIPALGVLSMISTKDPAAVINEIHLQNGFAILAHPRRIKWNCPREVLEVVDAVEIWNVGYDGKFLPLSQGIKAFERMKQINPGLLAVASHDLHKVGGFYDVSLEMTLDTLNPPAILAAIREGRYRIKSRFFRTDSQAHLTRGKSTSVRLFSWQLQVLRKARNTLLRWAS